MAGKHKEAVILLQEAKNRFTDPNLYTTLGNSYSFLSDSTKAEGSYLHAVNMIPSKFYPKYLLVKYYKKMNKVDKALLLAKEIVEKKEKVSSPAVEEIKNEMKQLIKNSRN